MNITIPRFTVGTDIETKDTEATAYILSIGSVMFDNYTLKPVSTLNITFDPDDPEQAQRTASPRTLDWWAGSDATSPTREVHDITWSGKTPFSVGMQQVDEYFRSLPYGKFTMPMKGPDFDYVILKHALRQLGMYRTPLHARPLDSSRTIERVYQSLELPPISEAEISRFWSHSKQLPHVAIYDAGYEGYEGARMYHALHLIKTVGYDEACSRLKQLSDNDVDLSVVPEPAVGYGDFIRQADVLINLHGEVVKKSAWLTEVGLATYSANNDHVFEGDCLATVGRVDDLYGLHSYKGQPAALYLLPQFQGKG